jgi:hypothetical protein
MIKPTNLTKRNSFTYLNKGIRKIDPIIYDHLRNTDFGVESSIDHVYLCSIPQKQNDGFYKIIAKIRIK